MNKQTKWRREVHSDRPNARSLTFVLLLTLAVVGCGAAPAQVVAPKKGRAGTQFDNARQLVHHGKFDQAVKALDDFLTAHPNHKNASRAVFLRAKSKMGSHQTEAAQTGFNDVIKRFPNSEEARKAEFKLAMIEFLNGNVDEAKRQFAAIEKAANGPYTPEAAVWAKHLADERK